MPTWPTTLLFTEDAYTAHFENANAFQQWLHVERTNWAGLAKAANAWAGQLNANLNLLGAVGPQSTDADLTVFAGRYRPSGGTLGRFISRIKMGTVRGVAFAEIVQPGATIGQNQPEFIEGRAVASMYYAAGSNLVAIEKAAEAAQQISEALQQIGKASQEVDRIRASDRDVSERFVALYRKTEEDWENRIKGYEAQAALKAPRTFWLERSSAQNGLARSARISWVVSFAIVILALLGGVVLNLLIKPTGDTTAVIVQVAGRIAIGATLLAFLVWWLRQQLRDVRTHEHFAEDAAERATMIETYAALRGAGLQPADLSPILTALYRPGVSSLNDDSGPALPLEVILKTVGDAASRGK